MTAGERIRPIEREIRKRTTGDIEDDDVTGVAAFAAIAAIAAATAAATIPTLAAGALCGVRLAPFAISAGAAVAAVLASLAQSTGSAVTPMAAVATASPQREGTEHCFAVDQEISRVSAGIAARARVPGIPLGALTAVPAAATVGGTFIS